MKEQLLSVNELHKIQKNVNHPIEYQMISKEQDYLEICCDTQEDRDKLYFELKYNVVYKLSMSVVYDPTSELGLRVYPKILLSDLILPKHSALRNATKETGIRCRILYRQSVSNHTLQAEMCLGSLQAPSFSIEINEALPQLGWHLLLKLIRNTDELVAFNPVIHYVYPEPLR